MKEPIFKTEAALCAAFIAWATRQDGVQCFAEWAGWDILLTLPGGLQLGIQAKLRLNADVIGQALPSNFGWECASNPGPDYRGVLVPEPSALSGVAARLGLVVFRASSYWHREPDWRRDREIRDERFEPELTDRDDYRTRHWVDWNPAERHGLPPAATDAIAGSPCPITLTGWKLVALDVLAELAVRGTITAKRIRQLGIDPGRWTTYRWLEPAEKRGDWVRGDRCPKFDEQHPTAYALALKKARATSPEGAA